ncbi:MAG: hypothetical protein HS115_01880 [Spirochaetales bacterium]|nr:hypothetical protein [Spirochaetales bacterium]
MRRGTLLVFLLALPLLLPGFLSGPAMSSAEEVCAPQSFLNRLYQRSVPADLRDDGQLHPAQGAVAPCTSSIFLFSQATASYLPRPPASTVNQTRHGWHNQGQSARLSRSRDPPV